MGPMPVRYDALLVVSFGGPERMDDVMPFLENVVRGRNVPPERLQQTAAHYAHFGGRSPLPAQTRALVAAVEQELQAHGPRLRVYLGNRNWHPFLADTLREMARDGVTRALAFFTSAYGSYSGCRQYLENIAAARAEVGAQAPEVDKLRGFYNHPGFVEPLVELVGQAFERIEAPRRDAARLVFTAHSLPKALAVRVSLRGRAARDRGARGRAARDAATSRSSTRAAAGPRASRGSSPTSWSTCVRSRRRA
jgi:ferrochelatase